ncbi:MAG: class I SAM-dependent methyltransferase [Actinomycetota bacterium]|nr:class I SAM-dependent methyltransferase [Actinomycetota bacterium]
MVHTWQATKYDEIFLPHLAWGDELIAQLPLTGTETVLDAGAGTGRDALKLAARLPAGRVLALESSETMLARLREKVVTSGLPVDVVDANLLEPLPISSPVDAAISVATFHWIHDHKALFTNLAEVMKQGAPLLADCGGRGNIDRVKSAFHAVTGRDADGGRPWFFADPQETADRLSAAGFEPLDVRLVRDTIVFPTREEHEEFLATIVLGPQLEGFPAEERPEIVRHVSRAMVDAVVDYVRLKIRAKKA